MINVSNDEQYIEKRNQQFKYFLDEYKLKETETHFSPSQKYRLYIEFYNYKEGYYRYSYTKGMVTNLETQKTIEIKRNIGHFLFKWMTKDNREYLLCGQDYQGYSIVELNNLEIYDFVPEEAYEGLGFCWASIEDLDGDKLIVEGCIWAHEYERIVYDFSNPLKLPYPELERKVID
jgi:hypothetical protein